MHLIENGLIFSKEDNSVVTVKAHEQEKNGNNLLCLEVIDQGHGIEPEIMDAIFEPFYSTRENGTGLGLAIVRQIVEMHSGTVEVESTPDRGCTMRIILPLPSYEA